MTQLEPPTVHRSGSGTPVVLLHPLGVDRRYWDYLTPLLPGYTVLTYDLPGHGNSQTRPGAQIEDMAEQLLTLLQDQALEQAHVIGVSLGGLVAQHFAATHPEKIDRLVLVDTVAIYPPPVRAQWTERAATARSAGMGPLVEPTLASWFTPDFLTAAGPEVTAVRSMLSQADPEGYAVACEALEAADATGLAGGIAAPTLVVCGTEDMPPFTAAVSWFESKIPQTEVCWLSPAQHAGVLEQPEVFAAALRKFLPGS